MDIVQMICAGLAGWVILSILAGIISGQVLKRISSHYPEAE